MYKYIFSNLDPTVFDSEVQICRYERLDQVQMDQGIDQTDGANGTSRPWQKMRLLLALLL